MPRHVGLAAYERELIALAQAVKHWRPYLWGRSFLVKTDHYILKFLLDQRLSTIPQHRWISKLMGFDFTVEYKPGNTNTLADALSHREVDATEVIALSMPTFQFWPELRQQLEARDEYQRLRREVAAGRKGPQWLLVDDLVTVGRKVFVPAAAPIVQGLLANAHEAGHEGVQCTLHLLCADFHIPGDKALVQAFVRDCSVCQRNKTSHLLSSGLLQPLPVPSLIWSDVAMDFIEGLPKVNNKSVILTVVDPLSKAAHFIPLGHPYTATTVARAFFDEIVRLHGLPESIVSDRDPVFTSNLWRELFQLSGTKLHKSSAFHPQNDGQSEAANKVIVMYLRCLTGDCPKQWLRWLPWAEYCFNTAFHSALKTTPFKLVYGRNPPSLVTYEKGVLELRRWISYCTSVTFSCRTPRNVCCKPRSRLSYSTTPDIRPWSSGMVIGYGSSSFIVQWRPCLLSLKGSSHPASMGHTKSWSALATPRTAWSCRPVRAFIMFFTWACSRRSMGHLRQMHRRCRQCSMGVYFLHLRRCCVAVRPVEHALGRSTGK